MRSTTTDEDRHGVTDGELLDRTAALLAERNRLDAELARTVRAAENRQAAEHDGLKTMASWLLTPCRLSGAAVTQLGTSSSPRRTSSRSTGAS